MLRDELWKKLFQVTKSYKYDSLGTNNPDEVSDGAMVTKT